MLRQEFIDNIVRWGDLTSFCYNEDCSICDDIYDEDARDEYIDDHLVEYAHEHDWTTLRNILDNIPTGYDWYILDDYNEWEGADDDLFDERKEMVLEWMDNGGYWEDEDEEEIVTVSEPDAAVEEIDVEDLTPIEEEDISVSELFSMCNDGLQFIADANREAEEQFNQSFDNFIQGLTTLAAGA